MYLRRASDNVFRSIDKPTLTSFLETELSQEEVDIALRDIWANNSVDYQGPLAGFGSGLVELEGGGRALVTTSPVLIVPKSGQWPLLKRVFEGMFGHEQKWYFYGWLKYALECIYCGSKAPGHALIMAGPKQCGKSLVIKIITKLLGGREQKPYQSMTAQTTFNEDWFHGEHLTIDDEHAITDLRSRRNFGSQLKQIVMPGTKRCHGKNKRPLMFDPFWRLTIALNDEQENLSVLPPFEDSIEDKMMILKTQMQAMPMPANGPREREIFFAALTAEFPAFVDYLLKWQMPQELVNPVRFGVRTFHHPDILDALEQMSPETRLHNLIMDNLSSANEPEWRGTASELQAALQDVREADRLFSWWNACGTYLGRLEKKHPDIYSKRRTKHGTRIEYTIKTRV